MISMHRVAMLFACASAVACRADAPPRTDDRGAALAAAQDTARRAWRHEVGVDTVYARGDTLVVWVSPRDWKATDAPNAGVRVLPRGRIVSVEWIMGG